jgi:hypothetical protein
VRDKIRERTPSPLPRDFLIKTIGWNRGAELTGYPDRIHDAGGGWIFDKMVGRDVYEQGRVQGVLDDLELLQYFERLWWLEERRNRKPRYLLQFT